MINLPNPRKRAALTVEEMERRQAQAVDFTRNVVGDNDLANEIESLSVQEYAERRGIPLANPNQNKGNATMKTFVANPGKTRAELLEELAQVRQSVDQLQQQLNALNGAPSPNPRTNQAPSAADLLAEQIRALREEKKELEGKLDLILDIASANEDGEPKTEDEMVEDLNSIIDIVEGDEEGEE